MLGVGQREVELGNPEADLCANAAAHCTCFMPRGPLPERVGNLEGPSSETSKKWPTLRDFHIAIGYI